ncbi:MFS transporter, UMF1 family [Methylocaldum marinum]|uniref:MFS transporter, UMF1 family n=1 Tax=Methylocaldum marinum TaxID=1432792 RepID=A0A250KVH7_9GAMM|nr:MFS transporter [Methylocaldum marinum]BBA33789.1 MFS transporter, UMF1 family [Methylocaldum marinum]
MDTSDSTFLRSRERAWVLYDVATSSFATTVMAAFFPVFFKQFWASDLPVTESTFWLGAVSSVGALVALALAPVLGALSDAGGWKKPLLALCAFIGISMSAGLFWIEAGAWELALILYGLGLVGFSTGMVFYDALLPTVTIPARFEHVSAFGVGMGYFGGGALFAVNILMTQKPEWFGFADASVAVRMSFLSVAVWWFVFTLPLLFVVPEPPPRCVSGSAVRSGLRQLRETFQGVRKLKIVMLFLGAYWLYIDGVDTIVHMAVDYALAIGFDAGGLMLALLITQIVGVPATLAYGWLGQRFGAKSGILAGLAAYALLVVWGSVMSRQWEFYGIAVGIGLVQGGVQAMSRALFARLIPKEKSGEFFGFFNLLSKFAAVLGPVLVGIVSYASGEPRLSILSLLVLFGLGGALLWFVDVAEGERRAAEL